MPLGVLLGDGGPLMLGVIPTPHTVQEPRQPIPEAATTTMGSDGNGLGEKVHGSGQIAHLLGPGGALGMAGVWVQALPGQGCQMRVGFFTSTGLMQGPAQQKAGFMIPMADEQGHRFRRTPEL